MFRDLFIENVTIYICTTILVLGLYSMSNSWHSLWALVLLLFVNTSKTNKKRGITITDSKENE